MALDVFILEFVEELVFVLLSPDAFLVNGIDSIGFLLVFLSVVRKEEVIRGRYSARLPYIL